MLSESDRSDGPVFSWREMKENTTMNIEHWLLADVKPYEQNPRINDAAVEAVKTSIREYGFRQPIVVDEVGVIIVGHTR